MGWKKRSRSEWQGLVSGWERSGLTQAVYCERQGISLSSLQRWRRIFAQDAVEGDGSSAARPESAFLPVTLVGDPPAPGGAELTLVLNDGVRLEIGARCPAETLHRVLGVLQERA